MWSVIGMFTSTPNNRPKPEAATSSASGNASSPAPRQSTHWAEFELDDFDREDSNPHSRNWCSPPPPSYHTNYTTPIENSAAATIEASARPPPYTLTPSELPPRPILVTHQNAYCNFLAYVALALLFVGGQIPIYLFGSVQSYIHKDIGGADLTIWYLVANLIAMAAITPFAGALSDIIGRLPILLAGASFMIIGLVLVLVCKTVVQLITYMALTGLGAGMVELGALVILREMAPRSRFPKHAALVVLCLLPFCASVIFAQLIANSSSWRCCALLPLSCVSMGLLLAIAFCRPPRQGLSATLSRWDMFKRADILGGYLFASFIAYMLYSCFLGGSQNLWTSKYVSPWGPLMAACHFIIFVIWEVYRARKGKSHLLGTSPSRDAPEGPGEGDNIAVGFAFLSAYLSGAFFYALLAFWPAQYSQLYATDTTGLDPHSLLISLAFLVGALASLGTMSATPKAVGPRAELVLFAGKAVLWSILLSFLSAEVHLDSLCVILFLFVMGIGGGFIPSGVATTMATKHKDRGMATGMALSLRIIGGFHGYAVLHAVFKGVFYSELKYRLKDLIHDPKILAAAMNVTPASILKDFQEISTVLLDMGYDNVDLVAEGRQALLEAYAAVWFSTWITVCVVVGIVLFLASVKICCLDSCARPTYDERTTDS